MYACMHVAWSMHVFMDGCMRVCMYLWKHASMHTHAPMHMHAHMHCHARTHSPTNPPISSSSIGNNNKSFVRMAHAEYEPSARRDACGPQGRATEEGEPPCVCVRVSVRPARRLPRETPIGLYKGHSAWKPQQAAKQRRRSAHIHQGTTRATTRRRTQAKRG